MEAPCIVGLFEPVLSTFKVPRLFIVAAADEVPKVYVTAPAEQLNVVVSPEAIVSKFSIVAVSLKASPASQVTL